ncbi:MAG: NGG1p interacting factor NIF3 [endosymbiont of Galathealinum brachiosum]|uniref:NGG1p interacting factor NIF3 n=1 Tax=endosymbiont of Galathealinum brachiosum TaxID=2200906 RepID=A0A370DHS3_9GAMM|nr:MAG: NGG1p interacting factor NIF3 [endosymbiont of Galathealinum brachiosum]
MYKLCVYIPTSHLQPVKTAMFEAGAGQIGNYDSCCWQSLGQGQFRPLKGSQPFIGQTGKVEIVEEYKVELVVKDSLIRQVVASMKQAHPYEEPAYDIWQLTDI